MEKLDKYRQTVGLVLLMVFAMYNCGLTLFPHTHTDGNATITHSHPYLPGTAHNHTAAQLQLISEAASTAFCQVDSPEAVQQFCLVTAIFETAVCDIIPLTALRHFSLRAPPAERFSGYRASF